MPTLDEWENALSMFKRIHIVSDEQLVDAVNNKPNSPSYNGPRKQATIAQQVSPNRSVIITPFELLGAMGTITTPRITNLVDLCSTWARIRYIWAFNPEQPYPGTSSEQLRLSSEAKIIDRHQKTLLSDEIGMAMAALVMEKYFDAYNPVDVDVALAQGNIPGLHKTSTTAPDYIFQNITDQSYMIVECKGTGSGFNKAIDQLKRGTEQVLSLSLPNTTIPSYVIATEMHIDYIKVYVIDPPSRGDENKREIKVSDEREFKRAVQQVQTANLFRYVGAFNRSYQVERYHERRPLNNFRDPPSTEYVNETQADFVGIRQDFQVPGEFGLVSTFQGIPEQMYISLTQGEYDNANRRAEQIFTSVRRVVRHTPSEDGSTPSYFSVRRTDRNLLVRLFRRDGTLLQIDISA